MDTATVTLACGHKRRIRLSGTASNKSAQVFMAATHNCPQCNEKKDKE